MNMVEMKDARNIVDTYDEFCEVIMGKGYLYDEAITALMNSQDESGYVPTIVNMTRQVAEIQFGDLVFRLYNDSDDGFRIDDYAWYHYELPTGVVAQIKIMLD